jgi:hypothetical protein
MARSQCYANGDLVTELHSGEVIGEMSLVDPARTTASVLANEGARRRACHTPACATSS